MIRPLSIEHPAYYDKATDEIVIMASDDGTLPETGADVEGLRDTITFSAGSVVIDTKNSVMYIHDGQKFTKWEG